MPADNSRHLTPQQHTAIQQLLLGATITEAAQAAGVTRQTVKPLRTAHLRTPANPYELGDHHEVNHRTMYSPSM